MPIMDEIEKGRLGFLRYLKENDADYSSVDDQHIADLEWLLKKTRGSIFVISEPFAEAYKKSVEKLTAIFIEEKDNPKCINRIYIYATGFFMFYLEVNDKKEVATGCATFTKQGVLIWSAFDIPFGERQTKGYTWTSPATREVFKLYDSKGESKFIADCMGLYMGMDLFQRYADVEIREVNNNRKIEVDGEKIKNETVLPVRYLTCKWFTTLVRSEDFRVRGHFRLQAYGEGWSKRRLVWINEFEKHGYISKAGKLADPKQ